jgi:DNA-binding LacI/PurR family transcriptional regulator
MTQEANTVAPSIGRDSGNLLASLREEIESGKVAAGEFLPTVRRLSEERGVAHGTAWRALKALECEGLVEAIPRHGYRVLRRSEGQASGGRLAYVLSQENIAAGSWDLLYSGLLSSLETCAQRGGQRMTKMIMNPGEEGGVIEQLQSAGLSGLIVDTPSRQLLAWARRSGVPAVVVDDWRPGLEADAVVQGNHDGGELAAGHLVELGCERIAWLGLSDNYHGGSRYGGARAALCAAGLGLHAELNVDLRSPELVGRVEKLLREHRPDGVVALWRPLATAASAAAERLGLEVGSDLRLVGWSCDEMHEEGFAALFAGKAVPAAVSWSITAMAELAMARLAQRRESPDLPISCTTVPVRLIPGTGN